MSKSKPARIVVSYSHRDESLRSEMVAALSPAIRAGELDIWSDHKIVPGADIDSEIMEQLKEADAVVLLVSNDFIASEYCFKTELEVALDRHSNGRATVLPIVVRPTDFTGMPFARLKMLPEDAKAVTIWTNRDEAWLNVARGIRSAIAALPKNEEKPSVFKSKNIKQCLAESFDILQKKYQDQIAGPGTGFAGLDELLALMMPEDVILLAGRPASGFSELAVSMIQYAAIKRKQKIRVISQRLSSQKYANRMLCAAGFVSLIDIETGQLEDEDWSRVAGSIRILKEADIIIDDETIRSLDGLAKKLNEIAVDGCDVLAIDGLEYISSGSHQDEKAIAFLLRDFSRSKKCTLMLTLALGCQVDGRAIKRPVIADLANWDALEHVADRIFFVSRSDLYDLLGRDYGQISPLIVDVVKNTDGILGEAALRLHTSSGAVSEN
ncbi:MAG: TIR domain-containing protein [Xanthomonadales bacterium]|nr:TIR domain-containing protein [Xanthomonadales bacterium]